MRFRVMVSFHSRPGGHDTSQVMAIFSLKDEERGEGEDEEEEC